MTDDSGAVELPKFDALADEAVKLSFDVFMAKAYKIASDRAREEFTGERDRLTAEITALNAELLECREFCDSQSGLIESLEKTTEQLSEEATQLKATTDELNNRILMLSVENGKLLGMIEVYNALGGTAATTPTPEGQKKTATKKATKSTTVT